MYSVLTYFCKICKLEFPSSALLPPMFLKRASKLIILHAPQNSALVHEADWVLMASSSQLADTRREIVAIAWCLEWPGVLFWVSGAVVLLLRTGAGGGRGSWRRAGGGVVWP